MQRLRIGGDLDVCRLGFGAMHLTGSGLWGEPDDRGEARRVLRRLPDLGLDFVDTADSYGPGVSERLVGEALRDGVRLVVATKAGFVRPSANEYSVCGEPGYLRRSAEASRARLGVERIDLWQLHRIDPAHPMHAQFEAIAQMIGDGVIRHAGLSHVRVEEIEAARRYFPVATVQNCYNLIDRSSEEALDYCETNGIGFIPFYPLAAGRLTRAGAVLGPIAEARGVTPSQIALAWLLRRSPVMLPIPGTRRVSNLEDNAAALSVRLTEDEYGRLNDAGYGFWKQHLQARR